MFSSFFSTVAPADPNAPNFHPVSSLFKPAELCGELEPRDTENHCPGGLAVETQTYYSVLADGTSIMCQTIHSAVGAWYPTIQFTFKIYNPNTKERLWKSINVTNFATPPPGLDKRSSKGDQYSITYKSKPGSATPEWYTITANLGDDVQIALDIARSPDAPGFKIGKGPKGGYSYFGTDLANPESYVLHTFWPRTTCKGVLIVRGQAIEANGTGMYVHAIQGMRPNLVAARWNFAHFTSSGDDEKTRGAVSAIMMEFTTTDGYGKNGSGAGGFVSVNVGSLVVGGRLVGVTAETRYREVALPERGAVEVVSRASHTKTQEDVDTGYAAPTELLFQWGAPSLVKDVPGRIDAEVRLDLGAPSAYKGLVEKVDVLAEIPYVIKTMVNYVAGTKPYIYQWMNPATLTVTGPEGIEAGLSEGQKVEGWLYNEATFIS